MNTHRIFPRHSVAKPIAMALALALLSACHTASVHDETTQNNHTVVVEERLLVEEDVISSHPSSSQPEIERIEHDAQLSPVVAKLVQKAEQQKKLSNLDVAANNVERALRIEPRNPVLWSKLAGIKFAQNNWQQALNLAKKSNTLNQGNVALRRQNTYLIVKALEAMGEHESAEQYRKQLN